MSDEATLRKRAREAREAGRLPERRPDRIWGGPGGGADCAICGARVTRGEVDFEIEFFRNGRDHGIDRHHVHIRCLAAWETELANGPPKASRSDEVA